MEYLLCHTQHTHTYCEGIQETLGQEIECSQQVNKKNHILPICGLQKMPVPRSQAKIFSFRYFSNKTIKIGI